MAVFSHWESWSNRATLAGLTFPGVYALALSAVNMAGAEFNWIADIIYVGMTNVKGGLRSRLQQFDNTVKGGDGHGGGHRVRFKHSDYDKLVSQLYVSVCPRRCDVVACDPTDLRVMGQVALHEYECFALFVELHGMLPEFHDKKRSPKKKALGV